MWAGLKRADEGNRCRADQGRQGLYGAGLTGEIGARLNKEDGGVCVTINYVHGTSQRS